MMAHTGTPAVEFRQEGEVTVAVVQAKEVSSKVGEALDAWLKATPRRAVKLVLDLGRVDFLGSVGLGVLVSVLQRIKRAEGHMVLAGLGRQCRDVMNVTGMLKVFKTCPDVPAAVEAVRRPAR